MKLHSPPPQHHQTHTYTHTYTHSHTLTHTHTHTLSHIHLHSHTHSLTHTNSHTHSHTHTHTHTTCAVLFFMSMFIRNPHTDRCLQSDVAPSTSLLWVVAMGGCYGWLPWVDADWCLQSDVAPRFKSTGRPSAETSTLFGTISHAFLNWTWHPPFLDYYYFLFFFLVPMPIACRRNADSACNPMSLPMSVSWLGLCSHSSRLQVLRANGAARRGAAPPAP